ncbi:MAG TPA: GNAT family protein [Candidatus Krumholzibacteria bacterium]|nr:GNAT family protein [Candidatus Krumholzibacteria bacterium]
MSDIRIRDVIEADLPILCEQQLDPDATRMAAFPSREPEAFMAHWRVKVLGDARNRKQTILFDGQVAGHIVSFVQGERRLIGYWLGKEYWGRGIATRALSEFLLQETHRPLFAQVAKHNVASIRVLEKCGFTHVGAEPPATGAEVEELTMLLTGKPQDDSTR